VLYKRGDFLLKVSFSRISIKHHHPATSVQLTKPLSTLYAAQLFKMRSFALIVLPAFIALAQVGDVLDDLRDPGGGAPV
jgi:metallophosphoesterase superfamily enzyme